MKEKLINDAIQYVADNHLEDKLNSALMKIIGDTHSINVLNIAMFVCVSIYINDKYINNEK